MTNKDALQKEAMSDFNLVLEELKEKETEGLFKHKHITVEQIDYHFLDVNIVFWHTVYEETPFLRVRYALSNIKTGERIGEYRWEAGWDDESNELRYWDDFFIIWERK